MPPDGLALDANALRAWITADRHLLEVFRSRSPCLPCVVLEEALAGWIEQAHRDRQQKREERLARSLDQ